MWDEAWQSYNNCYLVSAEGRHLLIDCGKAEQSTQLVAALGRLGVTPEAISHLIITHGHKDHFGGYIPFVKAVKHVHGADRNRFPPETQPEFTFDLPSDGMVLDFHCIHLGHHTPGSVALFHGSTGTLFVGDHICFFGDSLPSDGLVSTGPELAQIAQDQYTSWARDPEERVRWRFEEFIVALKSLKQYPGRFLCTGHGGVLAGAVPELLDRLIALESL